MENLVWKRDWRNRTREYLASLPIRDVSAALDYLRDYAPESYSPRYIGEVVLRGIIRAHLRERN